MIWDVGTQCREDACGYALLVKGVDGLRGLLLGDEFCSQQGDMVFLPACQFGDLQIRVDLSPQDQRFSDHDVLDLETPRGHIFCSDPESSEI